MRGKKIFCIYRCFSVSCYINGGRSITSLNTIEFLVTYVFINNLHWKSSGILIFLCKYSYFRSTSRFFLGCALFVARCNTIRASWKTKKGRLSYRQKYIEEFMWGITLFWLHALLSMSFCCFLRLLAPFSLVTYMRNGPYKDIYIYIYILLWVVFCVMTSWVNGRLRRSLRVNF